MLVACYCDPGDYRPVVNALNALVARSSKWNLLLLELLFFLHHECNCFGALLFSFPGLNWLCLHPHLGPRNALRAVSGYEVTCRINFYLNPEP